MDSIRIRTRLVLYSNKSFACISLHLHWGTNGISMAEEHLYDEIDDLLFHELSSQMQNDVYRTGVLCLFFFFSFGFNECGM